MKKEQLWGWIFQYNPYIGKYMAVERDNYRELTNGDKGNVIYADSYPELETLIIESEAVIEDKFGKDG